MPIPSLTHGMLPSGIHDCTADEIRIAYASPGTHKKRRDLWKGFCDYLGVLKDSGCVTHVLVDGSFVTDKAIPNDIDTVAILNVTPIGLQLRSHTTAACQLLTDLGHIKHNFGVHHHLVFSDAHDWREDPIVRWFQMERPASLQRRGLNTVTAKGLLRLTL